ncbi:MAG: conserved hypothetical protein partial [Methanobrevibacter sp. CfCl-M3]
MGNGNMSETNLIIEKENLIMERLKDIKDNQVEMKNDLNKRIDTLDNDFKELKTDMNKRLDQVDNTFKELKIDLNKRLDVIENNHLTYIYEELNDLKSFKNGIYVAITALGVLMTIFKFFI